MSGWRLLADIGGTNVRFARALADGSIADPIRYRVEDFTDFKAAILRYLHTVAVPEPCMEAAICAAGPVFNGEVQLTNAPWRVSSGEVGRLAGGIAVVLVNDLEAVALALPYLRREDLQPVGGALRPADAERMLAVNVGTGFGAALALKSGNELTCVPSEAGHMRLCALEQEDAALLESTDIRAVEDLLSGKGLLKIYGAHCERLGVDPVARSAEDIWRLASGDAAARACVGSFTRSLAGVARDLVLATAAWGGVFLCGGVVRGWAPLADVKSFREVFEVSGKMPQYLERTPSAVITREEVALLGLARMAARTRQGRMVDHPHP